MDKLFTVEDALQIQKEQMSTWKKVLSRKAYIHLQKTVEAKNAKGYKAGDHVTRGIDLDCIVKNYAYSL